MYRWLLPQFYLQSSSHRLRVHSSRLDLSLKFLSNLSLVLLVLNNLHSKFNPDHLNQYNGPLNLFNCSSNGLPRTQTSFKWSKTLTLTPQWEALLNLSPSKAKSIPHAALNLLRKAYSSRSQTISYLNLSSELISTILQKLFQSIRAKTLRSQNPNAKYLKSNLRSNLRLNLRSNLKSNLRSNLKSKKSPLSHQKRANQLKDSLRSLSKGLMKSN